MAPQRKTRFDVRGVDMCEWKDHNGDMTQRGLHQGMQEAWDRASQLYLERRGDDVTAVSYGNLAPDEIELGLLGDLSAKRILDFGCGGGQNAVACAKVGAEVIGIDVSRTQLAAARRLAAMHGVVVEWQQGDETHLERWGDTSFDLILAIQVLPYLSEPAALLGAACKLLRPGGRLVMSIDHPLRNCFYDAELEELSPYPVRRYDDLETLRWRFDADLPMEAKHLPLGAWIGWIVAAGLVLQQVIEAPAPRAMCDELWPDDSPLAPLRNIPHTAILVAGMPG